MPRKATSKKAASQASKVLRNPKSTKAERTAAASALSQREPRKTPNRGASKPKKK